MDIHATEEQQIEAIKKWWKNNGNSIITGVLIALVVVFGWRYWNQHKEGTAQQASVSYEQLVQALRTDDAELAESVGKSLLKDYENTTYASLGALALAKVYVDQGKNETAREQLQWVVKQSKQPELQQVAKLRLANLMYTDNQLDEALKMLDGSFDGSYSAMVEELKGDIYVAKGALADARTAYQAALASGADQNVVQMKLNDLGTP